MTPAVVGPGELDRAHEVARLLVETGAVGFRTKPFFTFTSGMKSPVYVDNRRLLGHPDQRRRVVSHFVAAIRAIRERPFRGIAGTATAGIPWAAWIADRLDLPMLYVRSQAKDWGKQRAVEGTAPEESRIAIIEDLAFTAGSLGTAAKALRDEGFDADFAMTIVSYETPTALLRIESMGLEHHTLTTIDHALSAAQQRGSLSTAQVQIVVDWLAELRGRGLGDGSPT